MRVKPIALSVDEIRAGFATTSRRIPVADTGGVVTLRTARLTLRPFQAGDLPAVLAYRNDAVVARFQGWPMPFTEAHFGRLLDGERRLADTGWLTWCVTGPGGIVGDIGLRVHGDTAEVGIALAAHAQGQGYASEALARLSWYAFTDRGMQGLHAGVNPGNGQVIRLLLAAGWRHERTEVQGYWHLDHFDDEASYSLARSDWQARR